MFSIYILVVYVALVALRPTRCVALALMPWVIFACSYDAMRLYPNYMVNDIDVRQLYDTELRWFGIALSSGETVIPGAWFAQHHHVVADVMAGLFYLCWVPVPLAFALCLYFRGRYSVYLRFSIAFLVVNLIGFCGYYTHPAAPPWYALDYGFTPVLYTPGNMAGLARFDALTGLPVFHALYGQNANVFAAVPSLHAAYMLVATVYAVLGRSRRWLVALFAFICIGIWFTAVYTCHHYIIDVLLGIVTALVGVALTEWVLAHTARGRRWTDRYMSWIRR